MEQNSLMRDIHHIPLLLRFVNRYNVTLIIGRILSSSISKDKLAEAVQAYMGLFYLHRLTSTNELRLTMQQHLVFQDKNASMDLCGNFNKTLFLTKNSLSYYSDKLFFL